MNSNIFNNTLNNKVAFKRLGLRVVLRIALLVSMGLISTSSFAAEESPEAVEKQWSGQSELGFVLTEGNSETQSLNGKFNLTGDGVLWRKKFGLEVLSAAQNDETSAERYGAEGQLDRKLNETNFLFGNLNYTDDRFSGFDYETGLTIGVGRTLFKDDKKSLVVDIGPGFRVSKPTGASSEEEATLGLGLDYGIKLSDSAQFTQTFDVDVGEDRTVSTSVTALTSQVVGNLAMKFSITVKHNSEPPIDVATGLEVESTDTETAVTLVYGF